MGEPVLEIEEASKIIGKLTIVHPVRLKAERGEVIALCGANGAGKSTLIRMIVGILRPSHGVIRVNGLQRHTDRKRYAAQIGYMPDEYRFGNRLSARETLSFWAAMRGVRKERVDEVLDEVGLLEAGKKPVSSFSKGMRQRVLFAQSLLAHPPLLVLDEPTNGLDPYWIESFVRLIKSVKAAGRTVIFSTHQIHIAEALSDRVVLMNEGRVELDEPMQTIRQRYAGSGLHQAFANVIGVEEI